VHFAHEAVIRENNMERGTSFEEKQVLPSSTRTQALKAWEQLEYGMFIHFGMSTFAQEEFGKKTVPITTYHPTHLDVEQWVRVAKEAGMHYAVLTSKHCYGHCLWPSKQTDWDVEASPVKTDVVGEFVKACRKHKIKPGLYYLLGWDAHHQPSREPARYEAFCLAQIEELLTRYKPLVELWLDIPFDLGTDTAGTLKRIYTRVKSLQPDCLILFNQAFVDGSAIRMANPSYFYQQVSDNPIPLWPTDLVNGERTLPPEKGHDPWMTFEDKKYYIPMEVCDTLAENWFWVEGDKPKPLEMLLNLYRECRRRNANLLLDVAPDRTGRIPDESVNRLKELREAFKER
jgi:alpha-L-fucosidase